MNGPRAAGTLPLLLLVLTTFLAAAPAAAQAPREDAGSSVVYLVRHAEKADDDPRDPTLTEGGLARARALVRALADVPLTAVHSTDYRRTRETAGPVAEDHGLEVRLYTPGGPEWMDFVEMLRSTPGHHLVVGHSNTTPALVRQLGGDPVSAISEMEYDRLYVVTVGADGTVASSLLRVGPPSPEPVH